MTKHKLAQRVLDAYIDDVYHDVARIPSAHRDGIKEGELCRVKCKGKPLYLVVRGSENHTSAIIKLDRKTREEFKIEKGEDHEFEFTTLCFPMRYWASCFASDTFARTTFQMSLISLCLGIVSLILGVITILPRK